MFEIGEIVYHDYFIFNDGEMLDPKENRPCIVLFTFNYNDRSIVCTCPLTTNIESFNKHPGKYIFIPEVIYNEKKLSFLNLENISLHEDTCTYKTDIRVSKDVVDNIIFRFRGYSPKSDKLKIIYSDIIKVLDYIQLFDDLECEMLKNENKKEKLNKRRLAKQKNS